MGEFRGEGLRIEYSKRLDNLQMIVAALLDAIEWHGAEMPDNETLGYLLDAEDRLYKILADDFGITREEIYGQT